MKKFLVSTYWRGSLNIKNMRLVDSVKEAAAYLKTTGEDLYFSRVYEVFKDLPPRLIRDLKKGE